MKVLVIGSGGREHALVWKMAQSQKIKKIFCAPGNPGIGELAENITIPATELDQLVKFAKKEKIDLTVVGPEAPLIGGIVDLFTKNKLSIIGPSKRAAQIEGSKVFAKKLMLKYKIPSAKFAVFDNYREARIFLKSQKYPLVVKADGQCAGKGVAVCKSNKEAQIFLRHLMVDQVFGHSGDKVIIEECLVGQEVSFMVATDGKDFISFLPSQDHKRANDFDRGPNTGGMGAYAPVPYVDKKVMDRIESEIVIPTLKGMSQEGCLYQGILYPGLIMTKEGPKVLEYNCRFGDPETQPLMRLLKTDLIDIFEAIIDQRVKKIKIRWNKGSSVCAVLTSKGYPGEYEKGREIMGLNNIKINKKIAVFHAGTKKAQGKAVTSGGRVLGVTSYANNLVKAMKNVYGTIGKKGIYFSGMHYRKDIGRKGLRKDLWY